MPTTDRLRARLSVYGARLLTIDGCRVVEMIDPNDGSRSRYQYRRDGASVARRVVRRKGAVVVDWTLLSPVELAVLVSVHGDDHPILNALGL